MGKFFDAWLMRAIAASFVFGFVVGQGQAADLQLKAQAVPYMSVCTIQQCTGFYIGGHIEGAGSSSDIAGTGIGNVFASGAGMGAHAGYQLWNGNFFAAAEVGGTYYSGSTSLLTTLADVDPRWSVDYLGKFGVGLQGFFGGGQAATPSQGPVAVFQNLQASLISPYMIVGGRTRAKLAPGLVAGAGAEYTLGGGWNAYAEYLHVNYNQASPGMAPLVIGTENVVRAGINRKF